MKHMDDERRVTIGRIAGDILSGFINRKAESKLRQVVSQIPAKKPDDRDTLANAVRNVALRLPSRNTRNLHKGFTSDEVIEILDTVKQEFDIPDEVIKEALKSTQKPVQVGKDPSTKHRKGIFH